MLQLSQLVWTALNIPHEDSLKRSPSHKSSTVHSARSCLLFALSVAGTVCVRSILQYWLFQVSHHFRIQTCVTFGLWLDWLKKQTQHRICLPRCNKIGTKMHNLLIVDQDAMNIFLRLWTFLAHIISGIVYCRPASISTFTDLFQWLFAGRYSNFSCTGLHGPCAPPPPPPASPPPPPPPAASPPALLRQSANAGHEERSGRVSRQKVILMAESCWKSISRKTKSSKESKSDSPSGGGQ